MARTRRAPIAATLLVLVILGAAAYVVVRVTAGPHLTPAEIAAQARVARLRALISSEKQALRRAEASLAVALPTKPKSGAPSQPSTPFRAPLRAHEVVGFVPYYFLSELTPSDFTDTSIVSYFGLQLGTRGVLVDPANFVALDTAPFSNLVSSAHQADDAVLLTLSAFTKPVIDSLARHPQESAALVAHEVAPLLSTYGLQGVDLDIEGRWSADRGGFATFVRAFAGLLRLSDPNALIDVDTFPQNAAGSGGFFNFARLAPVVDDFFIMAYAMWNPDNASANSPAISPSAGLSVVQALIQYEKVLRPSKTVLVLPFYGNDFMTLSGVPGAATTSPDPEAVTDDAIAGVGRPALWDPESETPYTRFKEGAQWHETWFDDALSLALKSALAAQFHLAGVGTWALGMEGGDTALLGALDGGRAPKKLPAAAIRAST